MRGGSSRSEPGWALTSATQETTEPLNSRWSSFSTAVFRSLAVSNSTNLGQMSMDWKALAEYNGPPTLCPVRGQSQSKRRPDQTGGRSLSSPIECMVSPGPGKVTCPANVVRERGKHSMSSPRRCIQNGHLISASKSPRKGSMGSDNNVW